MTINTTDIKLLESERMSDASDGGGRRTSRVIVDGEPGNIFPKVSRLDAVYGRVNLRKVYGAVLTSNLDVYAGAHAAITDPPNNERIHCALFSTGSDFDTRNAARDRIESYVTAGPESRMILYGRQLIGAQAILVYQRPEEVLPDVGEVFCLSKETGGVVSYQQFVRVGDVTSEVATFTDDNGDFQKRVVTIKIGSPLRYEFSGPDTPSRISGVARGSLVRVTQVADASRYYGVQRLVADAAEDALEITAESVYTPIVPTTQRETALSNLSINGAAYITPAGDQKVAPSDILFGSPTTPVTVRATGPIAPGSVELIQGSDVSTDDGMGNIVPAPGAFKFYGTVDYEGGVVVYTTSFNGGAGSFRYLPGANVTQRAHTRGIEINLANRGTVYAETLNPPPAPGTLAVDFRALGKWYRLRDNGDGEITAGDPNLGIGTIDYVTGACVVTLGALPDVESSVLYAWGAPVHFVERGGSGSDSDANFRQRIQLEHLPVSPNSLSISYTKQDTTYTGTANSSGVISGGGLSGTVNHLTGVVELVYTTRLPDSGSTVSVAYSQKIEASPSAPVFVDGSFAFDGLPYTIASAPITAGSLQLTVPIVGECPSGYFSQNQRYAGGVLLKDNGVGSLIVQAGTKIPLISGNQALTSAATVATDTAVATVNYTTGAITFNTAANIPISASIYSPFAGAYEVRSGFANFSLTGSQASFVASTGGAGSTTEAKTATISFEDAPLLVDLTRTSSEPIVPGSVLLAITSPNVALQRSALYADRNGSLVRNINLFTGAGVTAGSINYDTGEALLTSWENISASFPINPPKVFGCLTSYGDHPESEFRFRIPGSPVRPGSFYIQGTDLDGNLISATSDENGVISTAEVVGTINQPMGVASVEFLDGGEPRPMLPSTIRFNAVVLSNLPLNADILGLDPVRLPSDGRVPIFRPADVVVIHNTKGATLPNPALAATTYSTGRNGLSDLWLVDANGVRVPTTKYAVNLAAGTVTMAADLDLTGIPQPLVAKHRIEEMNLVTDVQINGTLSLASPLSRAFDDESYVSSALLFGDMQARVTSVFDQATWSNVWQDTVIGSGATAQYNDVDFPIEVLNESAATERWRINFTSGNPVSGTASFQVIGENLGIIATGNTGSDCAPISPLTGDPYFVIRSGGWGIGWQTGNQLRFNTVGATAPIWVARTVLPGATLEGDSFDLQLRGDVDA